MKIERFPRLKPLIRAWQRFAHTIGKVQTVLLLTLIFFLVLTPTGLLMRLFRRGPLSSPTRGSLWSSRGSEENFERQY